MVLDLAGARSPFLEMSCRRAVFATKVFSPFAAALAGVVTGKPFLKKKGRWRNKAAA
jgi:hypothetical protein